MRLIRKKSILVLVVCMIALGAVNSGAGLMESCAVKPCCCSMVPLEKSYLTGYESSRKGHNCCPIATSPCCDLKSVQAKTALAISSRTKISVYQVVMPLPATNAAKSDAQFITPVSPLLEDDRVRSPQVPIYLQTLTILC